MTITDELKLIIEAEVDKAVRDMERFDAQIAKQSSSAESLGESLKRLSDKAMIFSGILAGAGVAALKWAGDLESQHVQFEVLLGDVDKANVLFSRLRDYSVKTPFTPEQINEAAVQLLNYNVEAERVLPLIERMGDVSAGSAAKMEAIIRAYGQMRAKGKVAREELLQLAEAGVPVFTELARVMGVSTDELDKMVEHGTVRLEDVERMFVSLTSEGGKFYGMTERMSETLEGKLSTAVGQLKDSAAALVSDILPLAKDAIDVFTSAVASFSSMPEGVRRTVIALAGVGAAAGPVSKAAGAAVSLVKALSSFTASHPAIFAFSAIASGVGAVASAFIRARDEAEHFSEIAGDIVRQADSYKELDFNRFNVGVSEGLWEAFVKAGRPDEAIDDLISMGRRIDELRQEIDALRASEEGLFAPMREYIRNLEDSLDRLDDYQLEIAVKTVIKDVSLAGLDVDSDALLAALSNMDLDLLRSELDKVLKLTDVANPKLESLQNELEELSSGRAFSAKWATVKEAVSSAVSPPDNKKSWQEWFSDITGIAAESFGSSGRLAAELYISSLESSLDDAKRVASLLGENLDVLPYLEKQREEIKRVLGELFSVSPDAVAAGEAFSAQDRVVSSLVARYKELSDAIAEAERSKKALSEDRELARWAESVSESLKSPKERYDEYIARLDEAFGRGMLSASEYAMAQEQAWEDLRSQLELGKEDYASFSDFVVSQTERIVFALMDANIAAETFGKLAASVTDIALEDTVDLFKDLGRALVLGSEGWQDWGDVIARQAKQLLDMLPMLFIEAGLRLIIAGNIPLGLGFIFGGISSSIISGIVDGMVDKEKSHAFGAVYQGGQELAFAKGGVVTRAVRFATSSGPAVMGEAGPEAIMPLSRLPSGHLGVRAEGASPRVSVVINNFSGQEVSTRERSAANGDRQIEVVIGNVVSDQISRGNFDSVLGSRFGIVPKGVR